MNARDDSGKTSSGVAGRARGKSCVIFAKPAGREYGWGWQSDDGKGTHSKGLFRYFYECVQDARKHGYAVELTDIAQRLRHPLPDDPN